MAIRWERTSQVWGVCGNLGGGKTLTGVAMVVDALERGWYVVTNVHLRYDLLSQRLGYDARRMVREVDMDGIDDDEHSPKHWPAGSPRGSGGKKRVVVLLDEVAEWFDQYSGSSPQVRGFLSWLRHTSKRSQDVILIVQRREYLAKSLRILVARWIWVEDLAVWRVPVLKVRLPFCGGFCMRNVRDRVGNILQSLQLVRKAEYGQYYDTAQCLMSAPGEVEEYGEALSRADPAGPEEVAALALAVAALFVAVAGALA